MWPKLINLSKEAGLDMIQTYIFWNLHQPQESRNKFYLNIFFYKIN